MQQPIYSSSAIPYHIYPGTYHLPYVRTTLPSLAKYFGNMQKSGEKAH